MNTSSPPKNILITGGAGFIGSGLARRLLQAGNRIWIVDNLSTGFERNVPADATFLHGDISDRSFMGAVFRNHNFEIVLHLAAQVSNIISHQDPWLDFQTNVGGTLNVLEGVMNRQIPRLI